MTTCTVEILRQEFEASPDNARSISQAVDGRWNGAAWKGFREDLVQQWLDNKKEDDLDHELTKTVRPWEVVNLTAKLDPKQPWVGIEFETGYRNKTHYQAVINYLWFNMPFTAIDHEGCGKYPVEITFPPANIEEVMSDECRMDKLLRFMAENAPKSGHREQTGIHVNISTPAYRSLKHVEYNSHGKIKYKNNVSTVVQGINLILQTLSAEERKRYFGRNPYGWAYDRYSGDNQWIEFKLFDSTGDLKKWKGYKNVTAKIAELVEFYSVNPDAIPAGFYDLNGNKRIEYGSDEWRMQEYFMRPDSSNLADFFDGKIEAKGIIVKYAKKHKYGWTTDDDDDYF